MVSRIPEIQIQDPWQPVVANPDAAQLSLALHLEQSQWASVEELRDARHERLSQIVAHAYQSVPYYQQTWQRCGISPENALQQWQDIPLLTRRDVQLHEHELHSQSFRGRVRAHVSGGSTGQPVRVLGTERTQLFWRALTVRDHVWHRRRFEKKLGSIRFVGENMANAPSGVVLKGWGSATRGVVPTGPCAMLQVHTTTSEQIQWLQQSRPDYLLSYPSVLAEIAHVALSERIALPPLLQVRTFGEALDDDVRSLCQRAFGTTVVDNYSAEEVGNIALECREGGKYHVQEESLFVEILDEFNQPCRPGEAGRVVVTTLQNFAMPLIRYELGDYAIPGDGCRCGRHLTVLEKILGRQRNMFLNPNGDCMWPALNLTALPCSSALAVIHQFQVIQASLEQVLVRLVTARHLTNNEEAAIADWIETSLGWECEVEIHYLDSIPRSPRGKYEDFRSDVGSSHNVCSGQKEIAHAGNH